MRIRIIERVKRLGDRREKFLGRRPHRSFRLTLRRDYVRSLHLPGYISFTYHTARTLWLNKRLFVTLAVLYGFASIMVGNVVSQDAYRMINDVVSASSEDIFQGNWGEVGKSAILLTGTVSGVFTENVSDLQRLYMGLFGVILWLTTIWLVRLILAGEKPRVRDGLYSASAPLVASGILVAILVVQLIPVGLAAVTYNALATTGYVDSGFGAMVFWVIAILVAVLSLYWATGTIMALVIATVPGMYPMQALKIAGDLVVGRRVRILYRLLWMVFVLVVVWIVIGLPIVGFDSWLKSVAPAVNWLPIVPLVVTSLSAGSLVWSSAYVYLLYRKVLEDNASPA